MLTSNRKVSFIICHLDSTHGKVGGNVATIYNIIYMLYIEVIRPEGL